MVSLAHRITGTQSFKLIPNMPMFVNYFGDTCGDEKQVIFLQWPTIRNTMVKQYHEFSSVPGAMAYMRISIAARRRQDINQEKG